MVPPTSFFAEITSTVLVTASCVWVVRRHWEEHDPCPVTKGMISWSVFVAWWGWIGSKTQEKLPIFWRPFRLKRCSAGIQNKDMGNRCVGKWHVCLHCGRRLQERAWWIEWYRSERYGCEAAGYVVSTKWSKGLLGREWGWTEWHSSGANGRRLSAEPSKFPSWRERFCSVVILWRSMWGMVMRVSRTWGTIRAQKRGP